MKFLKDLFSDGKFTLGLALGLNLGCALMVYLSLWLDGAV